MITLEIQKKAVALAKELDRAVSKVGARIDKLNIEFTAVLPGAIHNITVDTQFVKDLEKVISEDEGD
ncbi:hypothetical protein KAR91_55295 [Candidatus Pacearchaeota archaeon]|nr:hypothetical protein [Candidatus Pacearchaeota archaeon]